MFNKINKKIHERVKIKIVLYLKSFEFKIKILIWYLSLSV